MGLRFNGVAIFVNNLTEMVKFYQEVIGIEIDWDGNGPYAEFKHEGIRFMMYERKELAGYLRTEVTYPCGLNGTFELAVDLPLFSDVDREYKRVTGLGARPVVPPRDEPWGMRTSYIADPEGNLIEIGSWGRGDLK